VSGAAAVRAELGVRPDLVGREPYGAPQLDVAVRLNTNENPHPPPAALVEAIAAATAQVAGGLNRYPDREAVDLRTALAGYLGHGLDSSWVWAANGSNEVLQQLMAAFGGPGRQALGFTPGYTMHRLIAEGTSTGWVAEPLEAGFTLSPAGVAAAVAAHRPHVTILGSPNNPTGGALDLDVVAAAYAAGDGLVIVDEAYAEFSGVPSALQLLPGRPRLVVTRTLSKAFALAGARVGYLAADPGVVDALRLVRLPYHLSTLTQTAACTALGFAPALLGTVAAVVAERERMVGALTAAGHDVVASDANFVLVATPADQAAVWQGLLERGVLVRDVGLAGYLRVTVGTRAEVDAFLAAFDQVVPPTSAQERQGR